MTETRREWMQIVGLLLVMLALFLVTGCASAPSPAPQRSLPPREAWPICASYCAAHGSSFLGLLFADPDQPGPICACTARTPSVPQTSWGAT